MSKINELEAIIVTSEENIKAAKREIELLRQHELKVGDWVNAKDTNGVFKIYKMYENNTCAQNPASREHIITLSHDCFTRDIETRSAINWLTWEELQSLMLAPIAQIFVWNTKDKTGDLRRRDKCRGAYDCKYAVMDHL